ncbi:hypothetical protein CP556_24870 [Natrinema sp. CBA1119]|uniref:hypothetical protein n=1 Tax=Natrinema sp. CBA1119 TaxID=1608465 RepID=UPI000BF2F387|nr:hypothetical protein [Natrinema sp. CBA1119]PGF14241.1 hypothetical protein CP556_24870 [Natrinema sp. CBA1119]
MESNEDTPSTYPNPDHPDEYEATIGTCEVCEERDGDTKAGLGPDELVDICYQCLDEDDRFGTVGPN